jgi:hypothetical protein
MIWFPLISKSWNMRDPKSVLPAAACPGPGRRFSMAATALTRK